MMKRKFTYFLAIFYILVSACTPQTSSQEETETSKDSTVETSIKKEEKPEKVVGKDYQKIVVVGDAVAEIVLNLVDTSKVVGIHKTLSFLPTFQANKVGYGEVLKSDFILNTKAEVVFADEEGYPEEESEKIEKQNIEYFKFPKPSTIQHTKTMIQEISERLKQKSKGQALITKIDSNLKAIQTLIKDRKDSLRVLYVYARGPFVTLTAGKHTSIDEFIKLAGAKNAAEEYEGMEKLTAEEIVNLNPHLILMSEESKASLEGKTHNARVLMSSPLYRSNVVFLLKEHDMLNFSINTAKSAYQLANKLYGTGY